MKAVPTSPHAFAAGHKNAFDALRIIAALAVLYSHSYIIYGFPEPIPIAGQTFGNLAVALFFSLSGYLVCQSWTRDPDFIRFALRRALRVLPGLLVVVLVTALLLGPLLSSLSAREYFSASGTWHYLTNALLGGGPDSLPGVFKENRYPAAVNGSLWTLGYEFGMYVMLALVGKLFRHTAFAPACGAFFLLFAIVWIALSVSGHADMRLPFIWRLGVDIRIDRVCYLGAFFFAGACAWLYRDRIRLVPWLATLALGGLVIVQSPLLVMPLLWIVTPYVVVVFAFKAPAVFRRLNGFDYSYGIYIYAFPIQQGFSQLGAARGWPWLAVLALSFLVTMLAAALSWYFVEKPALSFKKYISAKKPAPPTEWRRTG
jgi:peptidoglycan/LPS O-acetylase OafA/YrhL